MITGKTIGELTQLNTMISDTLIPVELSGSTYYVNHSTLTSSGSFSARITNLVSDSSSFSTRVTNLVSDSSSFSNRISYFTGSVFGTSSKVVNGVYITDTGSVSNNMLGGSISNSKLTNSSIFIGSSSVSLGATASSLTGLTNISADSITVAGQPTTYGTVNPAYIVVGLVNSVTLFGASQSFVLDTVVSNTNSQVSYNTSSGVFTLTAGVTYDMSFTPSFITFSNTTGGFLCYQWVDATTNTPLDSTGTGIGTALPSTETGGQVDNLTARIIYTPNTNKTVKLYTTSVNGTATLRGGIGTQAIIKPMNLSVAVQATATGTVSTNYAKYTRSAQQTGLSNGSVVVCNVIENTGGSAISVNTGSGQVTLAAGKTYRLKGMIPGFTTSGAAVRPQFCWYNETALTYIGTSAESYVPGDAAGYGAFGGAAEAIITTAATTVVSFRLLAGATNLSGIGGNTDFSTTGSYPWIDIQEIGSSFALNTLDTLTLTGAVSASGNVTGNTLISTNSSGNEGGEIQLAKSPNSTLSGSNVIIDQYIDRIRIFENGGSNRGAYVDLTQAATGVGTLLNNRTSAANLALNTTLSFDNLAIQIKSQSTGVWLFIGTVTGTASYQYAMTYQLPASISGTAGTMSATTTVAAVGSTAYAFNTIGCTLTTVVSDTTNNRMYRITWMTTTGSSPYGNFVSIERLL